MKKGLCLLSISAITACATRGDELDSSKFVDFYNKQRDCINFVSSLTRNPDGKDLKNKPLETLRVDILGLNSDLDEVISLLRKDSSDRPYSVDSTDDQVMIGSKVYSALSQISDFSHSGCDVDVKEILMAYLYNLVGGDDSLAAKELGGQGFNTAWDRKMALMLYLMAGTLEP